jgi:Na+-transporting NADH:ubiquinone oxidoreductase subunit NqrA
MKTIITILLITLTNNSYASFNRFWVGHKKKDVATSTFLNGLNKTFFKDTVNVGKGRGLISYQPYITQMKSNIPDELALVVYESEEKYKAIRSTPEGQKYSDLHWDFFEKETSKSTVTKPFTGELSEGSAYELNPAYNGWQSAITTVVIYSRSSDTDLVGLAKSFGELKNDSSIENSLLLITKEWIIEYRLQKSDKSKFTKLPLKVIEMTKLQSNSLDSLKNTVGFGEGVNFKF